MCGKKRGGEGREIYGGGMKRCWRQFQERKKDAHKAVCQNVPEENKRRYKSM